MDPNEQLDITLANSFHYVGSVILYYDHLVTFPDEIKYVWSQPRNMGSIWFFANRYVNFFGGILVYALSPSVPDSHGCDLFSLLRQILIILSQGIIIVLSIVRTYAIYGRSKKILIFLIIVCIVCLAILIWCFIGQQAPLVPNQPGCQRSLPQNIAARLALAWWANFIIDAVVFGLTLYRTWSTPRISRSLDLTHILWRDGALYFGIIALAYLANILSFYLFPPIARGALAGTTSAIAVSMASRLLLNLRRFSSHTVERQLVVIPMAAQPSGTRAQEPIGIRMEPIAFAQGPVESTDVSEKEYTKAISPESMLKSTFIRNTQAKHSWETQRVS